MRRTITLLSVIALLVGMLATMAIADDFVPDPDEVDIDLDVGPLTAEVTIFLVATDEGPGRGCNLSGNPDHAHFVDASVTSSDTAVATVSPSLLNFQGCGDDHAKGITITAEGCGEATVTVKAEAWTAQGGPEAVFNEATILVTITGEDCPDDGPPGNGEICAEPAAPAWANAILQANDFRPTGKNARVYGELIESVARHMEQGATFGGFAKHQDGYADAVWEFLKQDGRAGPLPIGPAGAARPGWECNSFD